MTRCDERLDARGSAHRPRSASRCGRRGASAHIDVAFVRRPCRSEEQAGAVPGHRGPCFRRGTVDALAEVDRSRPDVLGPRACRSPDVLRTEAARTCTEEIQLQPVALDVRLSVLLRAVDASHERRRSVASAADHARVQVGVTACRPVGLGERAAGARAREVEEHAPAGLGDWHRPRLVRGAVHAATEVLRSLHRAVVAETRDVDIVTAAPPGPVAHEVELTTVARRHGAEVVCRRVDRLPHVRWLAPRLVGARAASHPDVEALATWTIRRDEEGLAVA